MIAKTESGFEIELDDEAMNDVELVEAIVEMDTDGTKLFYVADRLLGKEGGQRQIEGDQGILRESTKWNSRTHDGR